MSSNNFGKTTIFCFLLFSLLTVACMPQSSEPPPTVQAFMEHSTALSQLSIEDIHVLHDEAYGSGRIVLYAWQNNGFQCLASSYLTQLNGNWEISDTLSLPCQLPSDFVAGYTNVSTIETNLGSPRQTVAFGTSTLEGVVRVIWADGLVEQVPMRDGAFLTVRSGRWAIERIDLIGPDGTLLETEDWANNAVTASG